MTRILDSLRRASALLGEVARVDRSTLDDAELVAVLDAEAGLARLLDASAVFTAGEIAERSRHELGSEGLSMRWDERKPVNFIAQVARIPAAEAARRMRVGAAVRTRTSILGELLPALRPHVAEALRCGAIGVDAAHTIAFFLAQAARGSEASIENVEKAETELVTFATNESPDLVADLGRHWRDALDPSGIEPRYEDILARQGVYVGRERDGIKKYTISAAPVLAATLDAVFLDSMDKKAGPRFLSDEDLARASTQREEVDGEIVEKIIDPRSLEQKRADILSGVLDIALRATREGPLTQRTVGSVTAVIQLKDLIGGSGFGVIEGIDEIVPASVVQQLACENGFNPVVVGNLGQPLYEGPLVRFANRAQRRALVARDGDRCMAKGCRQRASASHMHHVIFASEGGPTDIDNLVLLCAAHHHALHQGAFEIRMIDGMPWMRTRSAALIADAAGDRGGGWQRGGENRLIMRPDARQ